MLSDTMMYVLFIILPAIAVPAAIIISILWNQKLDDKFAESEYAQVTSKSRREMLADKGARGEYALYAQAAQALEGETHWLFNVYVPTEKGKTTEIDAILFHATGIFVIESKNYSGWIFGTETQEKWTQCLKPSQYAKTQKFQFYNPIMQNQSHINHYRKWLGDEWKHIPIHSIILFGDGCTLKDVKLTSRTHYVDKRSNFPNILNSIIYSSHHFDMQEINQIYAKTYRLSQASEVVKTQHTMDVRTTQRTQAYVSHTAAESSVRKATTNPEICPLCQGKLVTRVAHKGPNQGKTFLGCSNFPKCRYTK